MNDLRTAAQQALEALEGWDNYGKWVWPESALEQAKRNTTEAVTALRAALAQQAEPVLQTCNCRWDGEVQVQQCTLHEAHVDAIHEWAERAKVAERKLAQQAEPVEPVAQVHPNHLKPTDDGKPWCREALLYSGDHNGDLFKGENYRVKLYTAPPQQAEPVEPVGQLAELQAMLRAEVDRLVAAGIQPQRKPLPKHDQHCVDVPGYGLVSVRLVRAVERAHGITDPATPACPDCRGIGYDASGQLCWCQQNPSF